MGRGAGGGRARARSRTRTFNSPDLWNLLFRACDVHPREGKHDDDDDDHKDDGDDFTPEFARTSFSTCFLCHLWQMHGQLPSDVQADHH